ncbi:hypothetical protein BDP27DRAFT_1232591, partial [Rhodocollybia butyracea]
SAHLIWKLRCDSVIDRNGEEISETEAYSSLKQTLNACLQQDIRQTNCFRWGSRAISKDIVHSTWTPVLKDYDSLPPDWVGKTEVLVGIGPLPQFLPPSHARSGP